MDEFPIENDLSDTYMPSIIYKVCMTLNKTGYGEKKF